MAQTDDYGRHEAMHMACFLATAASNELMDHAQIKNNALFNLYQSIGDEHLGDQS